MIHSHLQQTLSVNQSCHLCRWRLWCRMPQLLALDHRQLVLSTTADQLYQYPQVPADVPWIITLAPLSLLYCTRDQICWWRVLITRVDLRTRGNVFNDPAIHNDYHTTLHSESARHETATLCLLGNKHGSDPWYNSWVYRAPANKQRLLCNSDHSLTSDVQHKIVKKTTNRRVPNGFRQQGGRNNRHCSQESWLHFVSWMYHPNTVYQVCYRTR